MSRQMFEPKPDIAKLDWMVPGNISKDQKWLEWGLKITGVKRTEAMLSCAASDIRDVLLPIGPSDYTLDSMHAQDVQ